MKSKLISYNTKGLSKTESSKLSKALIGYIDKSNKGNYIYNRRGLISAVKGVIIARSTFVVPISEAKDIIKYIRERRGKVSSWNIEFPRKSFKN